MNYREKYKQHYGIEFGPEYEVHHIDLNHQNDDIKNLLLLPRRLHHQYHFALARMPMEDGKLNLDVQIRGTIDCGSGADSYVLYALNDFVQVYTQCQDWKDYKAYLDGFLPNIHNIQIGGAAK
jgi:hypothetical protein